MSDDNRKRDTTKPEPKPSRPFHEDKEQPKPFERGGKVEKREKYEVTNKDPIGNDPDD